MVWGEALLKAYYLEDKVANYPRIVMDQNVVAEAILRRNAYEWISNDTAGSWK